MDQVTQQVGMARENTPPKEFAVEIVRAALSAWAKGDIAQASKLCGGVEARLLTERFKDMQPVGSISIGKPEALHSWAPLDSTSAEFKVPCRYTVERDGRQELVSPTLPVVTVSGYPGRWHVSLLYIR
jgi:hypothetical protein